MCFLFLLSMSFYSFHWFVHVSPRMVRLKLKNIKLFKDYMKRVTIEVSIWRVLNIIRLKAPQPFSHHQPFLYQNCVIFDLLRKFCLVGVCIQRRILKQYLSEHTHVNLPTVSKAREKSFLQTNASVFFFKSSFCVYYTIQN